MIRNDSSEPGVSCHVGTSRLEDPEDVRKRSWEQVDSLPYPDSEESEDDIVDTDESENGLVLINMRNEVTHPIMVDTCGERCAQLDDFSWVRPMEEWNEESDMPESEIDTPHIGDGVCLNTSDSSSPETGTTRQWSLRRDLREAVRQQCPGENAGDGMSGRRTVLQRWI